MGGTLWNEEVIDSDPGWADEDGEREPPTETVKKSFTCEAFECPVCGLHFYGTKEIAAADLPEDFELEEERERHFEQEYGND